MKILLLLLLTLSIGCEAKLFDNDNRQITAKNQVFAQLGRVKNFDISSFREDTVVTNIDPNYSKALQYTLTFSYEDSTNKNINNKAFVFFTPDGKSVIKTEIIK